MEELLLDTKSSEKLLYLCRRCLIPPVFVSHPTRHARQTNMVVLDKIEEM